MQKVLFWFAALCNNPVDYYEIGGYCTQDAFEHKKKTVAEATVFKKYFI